LPDDNDETDEAKLRLGLDDFDDLGDFGGPTKFRQDCGDFELGDFGGLSTMFLQDRDDLGTGDLGTNMV